MIKCIYHSAIQFRAFCQHPLYILSNMKLFLCSLAHRNGAKICHTDSVLYLLYDVINLENQLHKWNKLAQHNALKVSFQNMYKLYQNVVVLRKT